jgi:DNA-binding transcriptional regulator YiaG
MWSRVLWLFIQDRRLLQAVSTVEECELAVTSIATRGRLGLSQTELGQLLGVSATAVATWEREERKRCRYLSPQGQGHRRCLRLVLKMLDVSPRTTCRYLLDFADREEVDQEKKQKLVVLRAVLT